MENLLVLSWLGDAYLEMSLLKLRFNWRNLSCFWMKSIDTEVIRSEKEETFSWITQLWSAITVQVLMPLKVSLLISFVVGAVDVRFSDRLRASKIWVWVFEVSKERFILMFEIFSLNYRTRLADSSVFIALTQCTSYTENRYWFGK